MTKPPQVFNLLGSVLFGVPGRAAKKNEGDKPTKKPKAQDGPEKARERSWDKALDAVCATLDKSTIEKTIEVRIVGPLQPSMVHLS